MVRGAAEPISWPGARAVLIVATGSDVRARLRRVVVEDSAGLHPFPRMMRWLTLLVPANAGFRLRTVLIRLAGWNVHSSTLFARIPMWSGAGPIRNRLQIGADCFINVGCHFELNDRISIGDGVSIGHEVLILTSSHKIGPYDRRAGDATNAAVTIESGAWIGARSILLPGVTIGAGSIVSTGSVVNADVAANSVVAGAPATVVVPRLAGARARPTNDR